MSEKINDGGPCFPVPMIPIDRDGGMTEVRCTGITVRDWFAGQALVMYMGTATAQSQLETAIREMKAELPDADRRALAREIIAKRCYQQADAMLAARDRPISTTHSNPN